MAFPVHFKMKFHNVHHKPMMICAKLSSEQMIHRAFQGDQKGKDKENTMEINMASLTK